MERRGVKKQASSRTSRPKPKAQPEVIAPIEVNTANDLQSVVAETSAPLRKQWLSLGEITLDAGTQSRRIVSQSTIDDYAESMYEGRWQWELEPLPILFFDGENYYPGDGHHRLMAAAQAGIDTIYVEVRPGTLRDAIFYSTSANKFHGLPRTNADKRNQVELLLQDEEWQSLSDRAIAEHCGVSGPFVGKVRADLAESGTANISSERVDKRGRKLDTSNIGAKPKDKTTGFALESAISLARETTELAREAIEDVGKATNALLEFGHEDNDAAQAELSIELSSNHKPLRPAQEDFVALPQQNLKKSEIHAVAENQIELLSQKMGAKTVALLALDFCTLDEIKEIYADLSSGLEKLEKQN